ncbi:hypothetical protein V1512DRAFT_266859 [Lipomyces arxii]|uniref:uncharacterized protein n=1 Tax=Lipomyces arxii TaxID=56418 RepID=UPI0034CFC1AD
MKQMPPKRRSSVRESSGRSSRSLRKSQVDPVEASNSEKETPEPDVGSVIQIAGLPLSSRPVDYGSIKDPLSVLETDAINLSLTRSRKTWLSGCMFETFWTRPQRGRKLAEGQSNARDKMSKLCDCNARIGPHEFEIKLFTVRERPKGPEYIPATPVTPAAPMTPLSTATSTPVPVARPVQVTTTPAPTPGTTPSTAPLPVQQASQDTTVPVASTTPAEMGPVNATATVTTTQTKPIEPSAKSAVSLQPTSLQPSQPPVPTKTPNELLIDRLHALARRDPQFGELMKSVASGKASPEDVRRFQVYISQSNNIDSNGSLIRPISTPVSGSSFYRQNSDFKQTNYIVHHTLVFEFKENPLDRFFFPRDCLIRVLPNDVLQCEVLLLAQEPVKSEPVEEPSAKKPKKKKSEPVEADAPPERPTPKYYTPVLITLYGVNRRFLDTILRAVKPREEVLANMKKTASELKHTKDWWIYYQVDRSDADLVSKVVDSSGLISSTKKKSVTTVKDTEPFVDPPMVYIKHII